jgi:DNA polymerase-3 subunit delta'
MPGPAAQTEVISEQLPALLTRPEGQERIVSLLHRLAQHPPHVLLLEGAQPEDRLALALYWTALLNCPRHDPPCMGCLTCRQIQGQSFRDLYLFSGMEESIKIDQLRAVRAGMGQRPDHGSTRVMVIHQAQELTPSAANSLLKAMEEPLPGNVFVLLAPLRTWLLPTLVSRSMVLTLRWTTSGPKTQAHVQEWQERLVGFWRSSQGLFEVTAKKGEVSRNLVQEVLIACQHSLLAAMQGGGQRSEDRGQRAEVRGQRSEGGGRKAGELEMKGQMVGAAADSVRQGSSDGGMAKFLAHNLNADALSRLDLVLHKAHQALKLQVTPALVLDWVGVQVWSMISR